MAPRSSKPLPPHHAAAARVRNPLQRLYLAMNASTSNPPSRPLCEPVRVAANQRSAPPWARNPRVRIGAVVAVALLIGFVVWLLVRGGGGNGSSTESTATGPAVGPVAATQGRLRSLSIDEGHPIYWAGPTREHDLRADAHLERPDLHPLPAEGRAGRRSTRPTTRSSAPTRCRTRPASSRVSRRSPASRAVGARRRDRRLQHLAADERLRRLPGLEPADRGLRPVRRPGAADRHLGPGRARPLAGRATRRLGRLPAPAGRGSRSAAGGCSSSLAGERLPGALVLPVGLHARRPRAAVRDADATRPPSWRRRSWSALAVDRAAAARCRGAAVPSLWAARRRSRRLRRLRRAGRPLRARRPSPATSSSTTPRPTSR